MNPDDLPRTANQPDEPDRRRSAAAEMWGNFRAMHGPRHILDGAAPAIGFLAGYSLANAEVGVFVAILIAVVLAAVRLVQVRATGSVRMPVHLARSGRTTVHSAESVRTPVRATGFERGVVGRSGERLWTFAAAMSHLPSPGRVGDWSAPLPGEASYRRAVVDWSKAGEEFRAQAAT